MKITQNCFIEKMPESVYHADPCPEPSLSSSMCADILSMTEREAWENSRRLNDEYEDGESSAAASLGKIAHDMVLCGGQENKIFEVAPFDNWRTNDSKTVKADIESRGLIALNRSSEKVIDNVREMMSALYEQLDAHTEYGGILRNGKGELSGFANDGKLWNRIRIDWLEDTIPDLIVDYKTTALTFQQWERQELWGPHAKYLQWAHYRKVYKDITGRDATFVFVVQKTTKPYMVKVITIDKSFEEEVMQSYELARLRFANALKSGQWRGEPPYTAHSCPPPWVVQGWEDAKATQQFLDHEEKQKDGESPIYMAG